MEISAFLRETYPDLKKKNILNNINKPRNNPNRIQVGSLFSNESSTLSLNNDTMMNSEQNESIEIHLENEQSKHISFKDGESMSSSSHVNIQMDSNEQLDSHTKSKNSQQPRMSIKQAKPRASIRYRNDRNSRLNKRKASQQYYQTQYEHDTDMAQGVDEELHSVTYSQLYDANQNETIELDDLDNSKCFPWIRVSQTKNKIVRSINVYQNSEEFISDHNQAFRNNKLRMCSSNL
jgi:hypothetical protein